MGEPAFPGCLRVLNFDGVMTALGLSVTTRGCFTSGGGLSLMIVFMRVCGDFEVAVGVGFEPTEDHSSTVFKTAAFDHSASPPERAL